MRRATTTPRPADPFDPTPSSVRAPHGARICEVVVGPTLCALRVWSEAEWAALAEADRPRSRTHCPGLGWVGAVPTVGLN